MKRWLGRIVLRIVLYTVFLAVLAAGALAAAYAAGMRLPIYSDVAALAFDNWNGTAEVEAEANYDASLVRRGDRVHVTVDLALPETVRRLRDYLDGGRAMIVECGRQKVYLHRLEDGTLSVDGQAVAVTGTVDLELEGLLSLREGRQVHARVRLDHDRTTVWAALESLTIAGVPDPLVEPLLRDLARRTYTREVVLTLAGDALSPDLAAVLSRHRDALDLAFEEILPGQDGPALTVQAVLSFDEAAAFDIIAERYAAAGDAAATALAGLLAPPAAAQGLGPIGDLLDRMGGGDARRLIEEGLEGDGLADVAARIAGLTDCRTTF